MDLSFSVATADVDVDDLVMEDSEFPILIRVI
jgi:hypothetical protein